MVVVVLGGEEEIRSRGSWLYVRAGGTCVHGIQER